MINQGVVLTKLKSAQGPALFPTKYVELVCFLLCGAVPYDATYFQEISESNLLCFLMCFKSESLEEKGKSFEIYQAALVKHFTSELLQSV